MPLILPNKEGTGLDGFYEACHSSSDIQYGDVVDGISMNCYEFAQRLWLLAGIHREHPWFDAGVQEVKKVVKPFEECQVGDYVLLRWRNPAKKARRKSLFGHVALKYNDHSVIHLSKHASDETVEIVTIDSLREKMFVVSRDNVEKATQTREGYYFFDHRSPRLDQALSS